MIEEEVPSISNKIQKSPAFATHFSDLAVDPQNERMTEKLCNNGFRINELLITGQAISDSLRRETTNERINYWLSPMHTPGILEERAESWNSNLTGSMQLGELLGDRIGLQRDRFWLSSNIAILKAAKTQYPDKEIFRTLVDQSEVLLARAGELIEQTGDTNNKDEVLITGVSESPPEFTDQTGNKIWRWDATVSLPTGETVPTEVLYTATGVNGPGKDRRKIICIPLSIGCPAGCKMCQIGETNIRQLSAKQILTLALRVAHNYNSPQEYPEGTKYSLLGGGDPAFNLKETTNVVRSLSAIHPESPQVVSTVGVDRRSLETLVQLGSEIEPLGVQLSLLSFDENTRRNLVGPQVRNKVLSVEEGTKIASELWTATGKKAHISIMFFDGMPGPEENLEKLLAVGVNPESLHITLDRPQEVSDKGLRVSPRDQYVLAQALFAQAGFETSIYETPEYQFTQSGCGIQSEETRSKLIQIYNARRVKTNPTN